MARASSATVSSASAATVNVTGTTSPTPAAPNSASPQSANREPAHRAPTPFADAAAGGSHVARARNDSETADERADDATCKAQSARATTAGVRWSAANDPGRLARARSRDVKTRARFDRRTRRDRTKIVRPRATCRTRTRTLRRRVRPRGGVRRREYRRRRRRRRDREPTPLARRFFSQTRKRLLERRRLQRHVANAETIGVRFEVREERADASRVVRERHDDRSGRD